MAQELVLIADDTVERRDQLAALLRKKGWEAIAVADGESVLRTLATQSIDALAIGLPTPGLLLAERVRTTEKGLLIPLLGYGGESSDGGTSEIERLELLALFSEPVDINRVAECLFERVQSLRHFETPTIGGDPGGLSSTEAQEALGRSPNNRMGW